MSQQPESYTAHTMHLLTHSQEVENLPGCDARTQGERAP
jgi:hypothetical protein